MSEQGILLEADPQARRSFDYYPTPAWMTRALWKRLPVFLTGSVYVLEPCAGRLAIADELRGRRGVLHVETNDLDPSTPCDSHWDVTRPQYWQAIRARTHNRPNWGITNVPFNLADVIVPMAVQSLDLFATVLRLSWLEPTDARGEFLEAHPPTRLIVMPRHDFKGRGQTDSVTSAWFVWSRHDRQFGQPVCDILTDVVTKRERDNLIADSQRENR